MSRSFPQYPECPSVAARRGRVHPHRPVPAALYDRLDLKNSRSSSPHSAPRTPAVTATR
jgi:hypothetical protein